MHHVTRTAIALLVAVQARTAAADCTTYKNDLDACNLLNVSICSNPSSWTEADKETVNEWEYDDDPDVVCHEYWQKWDPAHYQQFGQKIFLQPTPNPDNVNCYLDVYGNGSTTSAYVTQIHSATVPVVNVDYCCTLTPHGPYDGFGPGTPNTRGANFNRDVKDAARFLNHVRNSAAIATMTSSNKFGYRSDSNLVNVPPVKPVGVDDYDLLGIPAGFSSSAEVDHIIPKKDSHGCPCGTNAYANAQVISKNLNASTQNKCMDPRRIEILKAYTNLLTLYPNGLPGLPW